VAIKLVVDNLTPSLDRIKKDLEETPKEAHRFWVKTTPKDTGNARNKTKLTGNTIRADYPYAQPLDKGRSRQAPQGMSKPTLKFIREYLKRIIRK
jgi:hypothetical protein